MRAFSRSGSLVAVRHAADQIGRTEAAEGFKLLLRCWHTSNMLFALYIAIW